MIVRPRVVLMRLVFTSPQSYFSCHFGSPAGTRAFRYSVSPPSGELMETM